MFEHQEVIKKDSLSAVCSQSIGWDNP